MRKTILIVEDENSQLEHYCNIAKAADYVPTLVQSYEAAMQKLENNTFNVVLTDIHLNGKKLLDTFEGLKIIEYTKKEKPESLIIAMSADPKPDTYDRAKRAGAWHFAKKPIRNEAELLFEIESAQDRRYADITISNINNCEYLEKYSLKFKDGIILSDKLRKYAYQLASNKTITIAIMGETGTGKEEMAKLIHKKRCEIEHKAIPFVPINCSHLDSDLSMSMLFGHTKGAFTGADKNTIGLVGEANNGILFLDEVHTLPKNIQQKLLRLLNDGSYNRIGETKILYSNFQLIVASTKNLDDEVNNGNFLLDLRNRISGIDIQLPALRDRKDDIPLFVSLYFVKNKIEISEETLDSICNKCKEYYWQGNVRQLFNALHGLVVMATIENVPVSCDLLPVTSTMFSPASNQKNNSLLKNKVISENIYENITKPLVEDCDLFSSIDSYESLVLRFAISRHTLLQDVASALRIPRSTLDSKRKKYGLE